MRQNTDIHAELVEWVGRRCDIERSFVDSSRPLTSLGLDSLKSAEFGQHLEREFGYEISVDRMFEGLTIDAIVDEISTTTGGRTANSTVGGPPSPDPEATACRVDDSVVVAPSDGQPGKDAPPGTDRDTVEVSLLFFSSDAQRSPSDRYSLFLECARFADKRGFAGVWIPERHFHAFGGLFPNPAVLGSAVAMVTDRVRIRAGSVVMPLHDPVRVAEEWAVVDNLSGGRVDLAFATGWSPDDFVLAPQSYEDRERVMLDGVSRVQQLWRGEQVTLPNGAGVDTPLQIFPAPTQPTLPTWLTCTSSATRFARAGELGAHVLTGLLFQNVEQLAEKIKAYRIARKKAGLDPADGRVTLMVHTFLGSDDDAVRATVEAPFKRYLEESVDLWRRGSEELDSIDAAQREKVLEFAFQRYYRTSALFGSPETVRPFLGQLLDAGVDEIAALIDFGVSDADVVTSLNHLDRLRRDVVRGPADAEPAGTVDRDRTSSLAKMFENRHLHARANSDGVLAKARNFRLVDELRNAGLMPYYRPLHNEGPTCVAEGRRLVMLGSNDYLGLTNDRRVREAVSTAALNDGPSMSGSAMQNGSTPAHLNLERRLAEFVGRQDVVLFSTGYQANVGVVSALMGKGTVLVVDDECHASIYDGAAVGGCRLVAFRHNDVDDLERKLAEELNGESAMVMVDGVFSMSGDIARLAEIRAVCSRFEVPLAMDDAHGLGMMGQNGRGVEEELDLIGVCDVLTGTFSKSFASIGGWAAGDHYLIDWIRYHGRSVIFSAAMPPTALAAVNCSLDILQDEPWRVGRLRERAGYLRRSLQLHGFNVGRSNSAIVPVIVGDEMTCLQFGTELYKAGLNVNTVVAPAVPANRSLLRTSVMATHDKSHLDEALGLFVRVGRELGAIS